ncbi:hypothetical protein MTO96_040111, partial [Rhipicephalus appendiculatus]
MIRNALTAISSYDWRIFCVAWFYCCLAERSLLSKWRPYRVGPTDAASTGNFILHERFASALQYPGGHTASAKVESDGKVYACVMATRRKRPSAEHDVICLKVIRSTSELFVRVLDNESCVIATLQSLLRGNSTQMINTPLGQLSFALSSGSDPLGDTAKCCRTIASYVVDSTSKAHHQTAEIDPST